MNKKGREKLTELRDELQILQDNEQERYERMMEIADNLQEAIDLIDQILEA